MKSFGIGLVLGSLMGVGMCFACKKGCAMMDKVKQAFKM